MKLSASDKGLPSVSLSGGNLSQNKNPRHLQKRALFSFEFVVRFLSFSDEIMG
jgi:hypothetical protein